MSSRYMQSSKLDFRIYWPENFKIRIFIDSIEKIWQKSLVRINFHWPWATGPLLKSMAVHEWFTLQNIHFSNGNGSFPIYIDFVLSFITNKTFTRLNCQYFFYTAGVFIWNMNCLLFTRTWVQHLSLLVGSVFLSVSFSQCFLYLDCPIDFF